MSKDKTVREQQVEETAEKDLSRRELLKKGYSAAVAGLLLGAGAAISASGCYEDYYDYYSNYSYDNSYLNYYGDYG